MARIVPIIALLLVFWGCTSQLPPVPELFVDFEAIDHPTTPLEPVSKTLMEGVYAVDDRDGTMGGIVVGRWVGNRFCLWSQHDAVYSVSAGGSLGDSIKLTGFIRTIRSASGAKIRLNVPADGGGAEIVAGHTPSTIAMRGLKEDGGPIGLRRVRDAAASGFHVLAHRGGGRNSDRLGISENCIPMIEHASLLGATGIEIDVRPTRDRQVILFHDDSFSPRTVQGSYLLGPVNHFDLNQIRLLGRLINGERIPTLTEALDYVVGNTKLSVVWIDLKNPEIVDEVIRTQAGAAQEAERLGRDLVILLGIPTLEVLDAYRASPLASTTDILIEFDPEAALSFPTCRVWAPRWTTAIPAQEVDRMHAAGRLVFAWTVDLREAIIDLRPRIDGVLSNYPSLVAGIDGSQ